jgi:hypothetical protein
MLTNKLNNMENNLFNFSYQVAMVDKINGQLIYLEAIKSLLIHSNTEITIFILDKDLNKSCSLVQDNLPFNLSKELIELITDSITELNNIKKNYITDL